MTSTEIAAYIGAAAWLPIVIAWLYRTFVVPKVTIVPGELPEIGFTTFGPIVNIRIAISSSRKPVIIDSLVLTLEHEAGDLKTFHWVGMSEDVSQIVDSSTGNRQRIEKEQTAIAFLVGVESLLEKSVRFQDRSFHDNMQVPLNSFVEKVSFDIKRNNLVCSDLLDSQEFAEIERGWAREFYWKVGTYYGEFLIGSPAKSELTPSRFQFTLSDIDIEMLHQNLANNRLYHSGLLRQAEDRTPAPAIQWNWRYPRLVKASA